MKKIITTLIVVLFATSFTFAGGGWATSAISITKDGGTAYSYPIDTYEGWTDGDWMLNTEFDGFNFGTPATLVLNGAYANGWTDDLPGYTVTSFILYYRVYKSTATPGSWSQIAIDNVNLYIGNNYVFDKTTANIDILALATAPGINTYILEVAMSKRQYYTGGSWNSMIPGGQGIEYSSANAGYKATFTKSITTDLEQPVRNFTITENRGKINANFEGAANIELYNMSGLLIDKRTTQNNYTHSLKSGAYLLRLNGNTQKVIVH